MKKLLLPLILMLITATALCPKKICAQAVSGLSAVRVAVVPKALFVIAPPGDTQRLFIVRRTGQIHILKLATGLALGASRARRW